MSSRTSSIVQIKFSFWSFEISEGILKNQENVMGLDSFSNQRLIYLTPFGSFVLTALLKVAKLQLLSLATCCPIYRVTE